MINNKHYTKEQLEIYENEYKVNMYIVNEKLENCSFLTEEEEKELRTEKCMLKYIHRRVCRGDKVKDDFWDSFSMENLKGMFSMEHLKNCLGGYLDVLVNKDNEYKEHKYKTFLSFYGVLGDF